MLLIFGCLGTLKTEMNSASSSSRKGFVMSKRIAVILALVIGAAAVPSTVWAASHKPDHDHGHHDRVDGGVGSTSASGGAPAAAPAGCYWEPTFSGGRVHDVQVCN